MIATEAVIKWTFPPSGWCKLNVDGSSNLYTGQGSCRGLLRDHLGAWQGGFSSNLGFCSSELAKLQAVVSGLEMTWDRRHRKLILECDCKEVVDLIIARKEGSGNLRNLLQQCYLLLDRSWEVDVRHVNREANHSADGFALLGRNLPISCLAFEDPPVELRTLLERDLLGAISKRVVLV
ncbi:hypothetical protein PTKIN_Ptkin19aG0128200 [Pterospermum kingtungense]